MRKEELEQQQSTERQAVQRKIEDFELELRDYRTKFEQLLDGFQVFLSQNETPTDSGEIINAYNHQLDLHEEREYEAKKQLRQLKDNYDQLVRDQRNKLSQVEKDKL